MLSSAATTIIGTNSATTRSGANSSPLVAGQSFSCDGIVEQEQGGALHKADQCPYDGGRLQCVDHGSLPLAVLPRDYVTAAASRRLSASAARRI